MGITALLFFIAAEPCLGQIDVLPPLVAPADGAVGVPRNARVVVRGDAAAAGAIGLAGAGGVITTTETQLAIAGNQQLTIFTPTSLLPANDTITVTSGETALGSFDVADIVDDEAPGAPGVEVIGPSSYACISALELSAQTARPDTTFAFFLADVGAIEAHAGIGIDDVLVVAGEPETTAAIAVVAVDFAGNVSPPTTVTATFPAGSNGFRALGCFGCASTQAGTPFIMLGLGLLGLRRRRR